MIELDPDSLRRRAIDARSRARGAISAELRRQFLELADGFDDLSDAIQLASVSESEAAFSPNAGRPTRA